MSFARLSRRSVLKAATSLATGLVAGCASGPLRRTPNAEFLKLPASAQGRVLFGAWSNPDMRGLCDRIVPDVSDMRWLSRGDSVFVKIACNSPNPHPAVTDPQAVAEVVRFLKSRGARRVYVGDQSGVEHVRHTPEGRVSSTRELMARNGLRDALVGAGARVHCFDDDGWDGWFQAHLDFQGVWGTDLWLPGILKRVDHVVCLPRLGAHALAGYTCAIKNAVGWLRDDSRKVLHQKGAAFFERIAEINHVRELRDKQRLALTMCHSALTNIGPDYGATYKFDGCVAIASTNLVDHDAVASAMLPWLNHAEASPYDMFSPYPDHVNHFNRGLVKATWGDAALQDYESIAAFAMGRGIEHDACLSHLARLQRYRPARISVVCHGDAMPRQMRDHLASAAGGLLALSDAAG